MEKQTSNDSQQPEALNINASFPFASLRQTLLLLDCSKFYLYKIQKLGIINAYYLETNKAGKPTGKPYYKKDEIANVFFKVAN